jgi:methionyl-tRNA formyltransferase
VHVEKKLNIILLCNNEIAFPAIRELAFYGTLKAVVVPEKNREILETLQGIPANMGVSLISVNKKNFHKVLQTLIIEKQAGYVWVMTFPFIIPGSLLSILPGAFINFHYGLLPKYRGPNPILAQMLQYETYGGITVHIMDEEIDAGPVIMQHKIPIGQEDTFGIQLHKLSLLGAGMVVNLLKIIQFSTVLPSVPQDINQADYFSRVTAADLIINWQRMSSDQVIRLINACNPWNKGAGANINNNIIRLVEAEIMDDVETTGFLPGTIVVLDDQEGLKILCRDKKTIRINIIYTNEGFFSGKKLAGFGFKVHDRFI